jgi:CxxC-x17-CxxC domain-containing protein
MERKGFQSKDRGFSRGRDSDIEPRKMYTTKCSECGQETEVPFEPDPDRPVYCRECYAKRKSRKF